MAWIGERVRDDVLREAYGAVEDLAEWSDWAPFGAALEVAPRQPGVYLFREPDTQLIRYVGMAGERAGGGRAQGLRGRLVVYRTGQGAVGGYGEAALDRALADPDWVEGQLRRLRAEGPRRARQWAADALAHLAPEVSWAACHERPDALHLESQVDLLLRPHGASNR